MNLWFVLIIVAGAYIVFIVIPAIISFFTTFSRKKLKSRSVVERPDYKPVKNDMLSSLEYLDSVNAEQVYIISNDGKKLHGIFYSSGSSKTIACFHGFKARADVNFCIFARDYLNRGFNILLVDERGHGRSGGVSTLGLKECRDVVSWADYLRGRPDCDEIVLYGISMGSSAVAYASSVLSGSEIKLMILDCGFRNPYVQIERECISRHLPASLLMPVISICVRLFLHEDMKKDVSEHLCHSNVPALFIHGTEDETVPLADAEYIYSGCSSQKHFIQVEGAGHTLSYPLGREAINDCIRKYFKGVIQ